MELLVVAGFLVVGVAGWIYYQLSDMHRDLELEKLARRMAMNFRFGLPAELRDLLPRFRALEKAIESGGEFQAGINSITGSWRDRKIAFFDYQWVTSHSYRRRSWWRGWDDDGEIRRTHQRSAVAVELGVGLQPVLIRPERLVDKALALVGYEDIDFDLLPEFSDAFYVNSPDRVAARRLVTPELARFFLQHVRCTVDFVGPWALLHRDSTLTPAQARDLMELAGRLSELVTREQSRLR
ncbi:MAG: hypothetical protein JO332_02640 [Planctomycetaceae bacterium]|nr:hypothetical protein [Planctomycetaceae bacterium]